jgi:hypothetical protein
MAVKVIPTEAKAPALESSSYARAVPTPMLVHPSTPENGVQNWMLKRQEDPSPTEECGERYS